MDAKKDKGNLTTREAGHLPGGEKEERAGGLKGSKRTAELVEEGKKLEEQRNHRRS